ncbi:MAG TPA: DAK2 domain-containing protein, partial [Pengzhenrongella sp.]
MERLDGVAVQAWAQAAAIALEAARGSIDSLNVFPVADGDTGTNLHLTIAQGADEVAALGPDATALDAMRTLAHGALVGARGNSGVIASQFLLGLARGFDDATGPDAAVFARALDEAQRAARAVVARPVEGTILTVATAAATAARGAVQVGGDLAAVTVAALRGAREALARTPDELAVLRAAGVVDAGATGLVVMLEALVGVVTGRPAPGIVPIAARTVVRSGAGLAEPFAEGQFEVMFLVESAAGDLAPELSRRLQALGESVAVVGGSGVWQAHV